MSLILVATTHLLHHTNKEISIVRHNLPIQRRSPCYTAVPYKLRNQEFGVTNQKYNSDNIQYLVLVVLRSQYTKYEEEIPYIRVW